MCLNSVMYLKIHKESLVFRYDCFIKHFYNDLSPMYCRLAFLLSIEDETAVSQLITVDF